MQYQKLTSPFLKQQRVCQQIPLVSGRLSSLFTLDLP